MKLSSIFLFIFTLIFISCKDSAIEISEEHIFDIQISERPIVLNQSCLAKSVYTKLNTKNYEPGLKMEAYLDSMYLISEDIDDRKDLFRIDLPEDGVYKALRILIKKDKDILKEKSVPLKYVKTNDVVEFVKYNIEKLKPIYILENACWLNYKGSRIPASDQWQVNTTKVVKTEVKGDSFIREIVLKDVKLTNLDSGKDFLITPPIRYFVEGINYLNLGNSIKVSSTHKDLSDIATTITKAKEELEISSANPKMEVALMLSSDGKGKPSFRVIGDEYGRLFKGKVLDCNNYDTLSNEPLLLPEYIQVELGCDDDNKIK